MTTRRIFAQGLLLSSVFAARISAQPVERISPAMLEALLSKGISQGIPGLSAAIATRRGVIWTGVAGLSDYRAGTTVDESQLFGVGSITKSFAAVVVLQLAEEGRLRLDATAAHYLRGTVKAIPNADQATILQLLNHTSGIPSWEDDPRWIREGRGAQLDVTRLWKGAETLDYIRGHAALAAAGTAYSYANTNYTLLGLIVEKVTGKAASGEIRRRILQPLGLTDIYLEGFEPVPPGQRVGRYHHATAEFENSAGVNAAFPAARDGLIDVSGSNLSVEFTAGGIVATAHDLALFARGLRDGRLLSGKSLAIMMDWRPISATRSIGHGLFREVRDGAVLIGHDGNVLGSTGSYYWIEGEDAVVAVLANVGSMHAGRKNPVAYAVSKDPAFIGACRRFAADHR
jgi:D-alanyl-D-alanine carboxypeptidase